MPSSEILHSKAMLFPWCFFIYNSYKNSSSKCVACWTSLVAQRSNDPPANAGDTGSIPDPGRSHMPAAGLSSSTTAAERELGAGSLSPGSPGLGAHAPQKEGAATGVPSPQPRPMEPEDRPAQRRPRPAKASQLNKTSLKRVICIQP